MPRYRLWQLALLLAVLLLGCTREGAQDAQGGVPTFSPSPSRPQEVGARLVGPVVYTVDARSKEIWMYFDFSRGAVVPVQDPKRDEWDLAFQRHAIRTNGGDTNPAGQAAVAVLEGVDFAAVTRVPPDARFVRDVRGKNRLSSYNPAFYKWYHYDYLSHTLTPKPVVYLVRTQDGKYAKLRILSYYCKGKEAGCLTFEYVYQGDGSPNLAAPAVGLGRTPAAS
ncbi:MAG: hypothetical protein KatS3mg131_2306 [Candidatus Tectimicrobiota bacterium]|nr:MAG: hypothetical protein KatS3mg131_2306 [Candidatus Tectomicrobia bacterium]